MGAVLLRADILVLQATEERGQGREEPGRIAERPVGVQLQPEEPLPQEDHRLRARQDPRLRRQPELQRMLADDAVPERVERGDERVRVAVRHQLVDAQLHLLGRLVGEGEGEDLGGLRPFRGDQPGDAPRHDLRLARSPHRRRRGADRRRGSRPVAAAG